LLAKKGGIAPILLQGSGPGGRIVKRDVEVFMSSRGVAKPKIARSPVLVAGSISSVPQFNLFAPCAADDLLNMQKKINDWCERKVSVTDLILKTVVVAFTDLPEANAIWTEDEFLAILNRHNRRS
jgi:pyruvate dehydrogenase E2 component (dihydrolipoamide acetyltransferase)